MNFDFISPSRRLGYPAAAQVPPPPPPRVAGGKFPTPPFSRNALEISQRFPTDPAAYLCQFFRTCPYFLFRSCQSPVYLQILLSILIYSFGIAGVFILSLRSSFPTAFIIADFIFQVFSFDLPHETTKLTDNRNPDKFISMQNGYEWRFLQQYLTVTNTS